MNTTPAHLTPDPDAGPPSPSKGEGVLGPSIGRATLDRLPSPETRRGAGGEVRH